MEVGRRTTGRPSDSGCPDVVVKAIFSNHVWDVTYVYAELRVEFLDGSGCPPVPGPISWGAARSGLVPGGGPVIQVAAP